MGFYFFSAVRLFESLTVGRLTCFRLTEDKLACKLTTLYRLPIRINRASFAPEALDRRNAQDFVQKNFAQSAWQKTMPQLFNGHRVK
jgi:hypothetical protein